MVMDRLFIETGQLIKPRKSTKSREGKRMVERVKMASKNTVRKIENAYAIIAMAAQAAAGVKVATLPKLHSSFGLLPVWQIVAGIIFAGIFWELFNLLEGNSNG